jgi:hypothetical protein
MLEKPKKERIKFTQYTINLAGDCFIDLERILEALKQKGYIIVEQKKEGGINE